MSFLRRGQPARAPLLVEEGTSLHSFGEGSAYQQRVLAAQRSDEVNPKEIDPNQLAGEYLTNDPDWPHQGCWLAAYMKLHHLLIERAKEINDEKQNNSIAAQDARGEQRQTVRSSMRLLKEEVFSLCPLRYLFAGMVVSVFMTVLGFAGPLVAGPLVDEALGIKWKIDHDEPVDIWGAFFPPLAIYASVLFASYICEILVGILFAICGHTTVTRLRIKLFRNLCRQEIAFYDAHVSGELSSRLINDSAALSQMTQFTTQYLLGALVKFTGSLVAMYGTQWKLALIATFITPFSVFLVRKTGQVVGYYGVVQNEAMAKANSVAVEVLLLLQPWPLGSRPFTYMPWRCMNRRCNT
jgi:hypothetical protein